MEGCLADLCQLLRNTMVSCCLSPADVCPFCSALVNVQVQLQAVGGFLVQPCFQFPLLHTQICTYWVNEGSDGLSPVAVAYS